jgi:hypothetical protein
MHLQHQTGAATLVTGHIQYGELTGEIAEYDGTVAGAWRQSSHGRQSGADYRVRGMPKMSNGLQRPRFALTFV